ncbi:MAG: glycosyltransferase [Bdellovibrionota bacterium]
MKVVLLHDWLTGFRGGERVLEAFCEMFPEAPLYTLIYQKGSTSSCIEKRKIVTSFLNSIPGISRHYRKFLPLFPKAAETLRITENADLVLSSSHCVIKGVKKPQGSYHISYVHSPMRYLYDQFDAYFGPGAPLYQRAGAQVFKNYLVDWDKASNHNVDLMIANSHFVKMRIQTYYNAYPKVVHPFVELEDFASFKNHPSPKEDFYIMVTAFAPNKRVDLAIHTFNQLGKKLKIIGGGQQDKWLRTIAGPSIEFLGNTTRTILVQELAKARALIFPGVEDFGITPLEALAVGTPVIAYKIGGVLETLNADVSHFFDEQTPQSLIHAILDFEKRSFQHHQLVARAHDFSKENFKNHMNAIIQEHLEQRPK